MREREGDGVKNYMKYVQIREKSGKWHEIELIKRESDAPTTHTKAQIDEPNARKCRQQKTKTKK